jgi:hypothetical protein
MPYVELQNNLSLTDRQVDTNLPVADFVPWSWWFPSRLGGLILVATSGRVFAFRGLLKAGRPLSDFGIVSSHKRTLQNLSSLPQFLNWYYQSS